MTRHKALAALLPGLLVAACSSTPVEPPAVAEERVCPPVPVVECPVCDARACPAPPVVEKVITRTVPAPAPVPLRAGKLNLPVIGSEEWATVEPPGLELKARIDTGSDVTVLTVQNLRQFEKDGQRFVMFDLSGAESEQPVEVETPVERRLMIKRRDGSSERRYIVQLWLTIGDSRSLIDVALSERDESEFPLQVGRNFLTDVAIVDVGQRYLAD
ncbi:ATP-dependent zinc protease family protein [Parahaliea maris]|uniref:ATP-dependent zinc protease family protein n=1 Tax=Parahaliea maris TaxID=2716870 RepID=UPI00165092CE|nr:RimK/LysX family protein [Parahaliea maris]